MPSKSKSTHVTRGGGSKATKSRADEEEEETYSSSEGTGSVAGDHSPDEDDDDEPVKKKSRKSATKTKSKGKSKVSKKAEGKLAKLLELPVDILTEVASPLDPLSLLYLSRTSKSFHRLLASRSSKTVWRAARDQVGLPDLEADNMTEMAYASLVCEKVCHICRKDRAQLVNYDVQKRFCKSCQKAELCPDCWFDIMHKGLNLHRDTLKCCLTTTRHANKNGLDYYFMPELFEVNNKLHRLQQDIADGDLEAKDELDEFVEARKSLVEAVKADAELLWVWQSTKAEERAQGLHDAKRKRLEGIEAKLESLGYEKRDFYLYDDSVKKDVDQPRALTDAIWNRVSSAIIQHVKKKREERLGRERRVRRYKAYSSFLAPYTVARTAAHDSDEHGTFPSLNTLLDVEAFKAFWRPDDPQPCSSEAFDAALPAGLAQAQATRSTFIRQLAQHVVRTVEGTPYAVSSELSRKILALDADESSIASPIVVDDDLQSVFEPLVRQVRWPLQKSFFDRAPASMTLDQVLHYADEEESSFVDLVAVDLEKWYHPEWASEVAVPTLRAMGLDPLAGGKVVTEEIEKVGHEWRCCCSMLKTEHAIDNALWDTYAGDGWGGSCGSSWKSVVEHIVDNHLSSSDADVSSPKITLLPCESQPSAKLEMETDEGEAMDKRASHDGTQSDDE
ncbi:hypothetical protein JCM8097_002025 [Rhodosporidiobolus ruineniae]